MLPSVTHMRCRGEGGALLILMCDHDERDPRRIIGPGGIFRAADRVRDLRPRDTNLRPSINNRPAVSDTIDEDECVFPQAEGSDNRHGRLPRES
jgi:hypothetical protein